MLHRALGQPGETGAPGSAARQRREATHRRAERGIGFLAPKGQAPVGTITVEAPDLASDSGHERGAWVARAGQHGVDRQLPDQGSGSALLYAAKPRARCNGYAELPADTPKLARRSPNDYQCQCRRDRQTPQFWARPYARAILAKDWFDYLACKHRACCQPAGLRPLAAAADASR